VKERTKNRMLGLLFELLKDSRRSDRELARVLGVSQPTVTRMRQRLVKEGMIKEFTVIPDFVEMGYELMAISCVRTKTSINELSERGAEWWKKYPNVIFAAAAKGMRKNGVIISLHKSFTDYSEFVKEQLLHWKDEITDHDTMIISLKGIIAKPLSPKYLGEQETETITRHIEKRKRKSASKNLKRT
jgi:DNA-binding Lrp family transcriptional regulator